MLPLKITRHGRERWHERVGYMTDKEIEFAVMSPPDHIIPVVKLENTKNGWVKFLLTVIVNHGGS